MTFDDGVLTICQVTNRASPGMKPEPVLREKESYYFGYETLGVQRYYTAMQAKQRIEAVVCVPDWGDIQTEDICIMESGRQYKIAMSQPTTDIDNLRITRLSLERLEENYVIQN